MRPFQARRLQVLFPKICKFSERFDNFRKKNPNSDKEKARNQKTPHEPTTQKNPHTHTKSLTISRGSLDYGVIIFDGFGVWLFWLFECCVFVFLLCFFYVALFVLCFCSSCCFWFSLPELWSLSLSLFFSLSLRFTLYSYCLYCDSGPKSGLEICRTQIQKDHSNKSETSCGLCGIYQYIQQFLHMRIVSNTFCRISGVLRGHQK